MDSHLNQNQIAEWMIGADDGAKDNAATRHFDTCDACRVEARDLRQTFDQFRDSVHAAAQRDDAFWRRQQLAVRDGLSRSNRIPSWRWLWAAAAMAVLTVAILLMRTPQQPRDAASDQADEVLLQRIQGDLGRGFPRALAPAVLLTQDRNETLSSVSRAQSKGVVENTSQNTQ